MWKKVNNVNDALRSTIDVKNGIVVSLGFIFNLNIICTTLQVIYNIVVTSIMPNNR